MSGSHTVPLPLSLLALLHCRVPGTPEQEGILLCLELQGALGHPGSLDVWPREAVLPAGAPVPRCTALGPLSGPPVSAREGLCSRQTQGSFCFVSPSLLMKIEPAFISLGLTAR